MWEVGQVWNSLPTCTYYDSFEGADPFHYVVEWYKKKTYLKAYEFSANPMKGRLVWPTSEDGPMLPSMVRRMPTRIAKKSRRELLESKNKVQTKLSKEVE